MINTEIQISIREIICLVPNWCKSGVMTSYE